MILQSRRSLLLAGAAAAALATLPARAAPTDPSAFVDGLVQEALTILRNKQMPDAERESKFSTLLHQNFDIPRISRFVLGRYWNAASSQERDEFNKLFEQWVVRTYSARFKEYTGETVKVSGSRAENDVNFVVQSELIHPNGSPPAQVNWHVRKEDAGFKILDVDVEGVSMALTERDEFSSVIQRSGGSVASLNQALQQRLAGDSVPASGSIQ
jgi:phospholipid transport system substrate-binding protein